MNVDRIASQPRQHKSYNLGFACCVLASLLLTALSLAFTEADLGIVLCVGIALLSGLLLVVRAIVKKGQQRSLTFTVLVAYVSASTLLLIHCSFTGDHVRWILLSRDYRARVLAQPTPRNGELKHAEWDGWGFAGMETTVFLVFDPTNSLTRALGAKAPVKSPGLPCGVVRVRRLATQWYAVLFYTETYWGEGDCR